jgi:hypothetical protein
VAPAISVGSEDANGPHAVGAKELELVKSLRVGDHGNSLEFFERCARIEGADDQVSSRSQSAPPIRLRIFPEGE